MSQRLAELMDSVRQEYVRRMQENGQSEPYLTAHRVCQQMLSLEPVELAALIADDPKLLSARASELVEDPSEMENPSVGVIVTSNICAAALEGLLVVAVNREWLEVDSEDRIMVDAWELDNVPAVKSIDYSEVAGPNLQQSGTRQLSLLFNAAEKAYQKQLSEAAHDAYQLALQVSSDYVVFAPDDLAPLIVENPLLLGLRADGLVDEELFEGDPPAGLIISAHLTEMLLQQLLELAQEQGALALDSSGQPILSDAEEDNPTVH
ncbi:hypothetical protein [Marinobacterium sediminicola]|uniref:Uncharacterized protein n=1 Tax=Marinobacterium sediminicola TaxID=518898 RepID=A0ABY1RVW7_9GAMM|nr:hypothetical protein [Marinobacterium sediminicola]ULG70519.1 hypothetical protein LN244_06810 [Marinobacterium sediminicola]SMR69113.1 hypothetical protein SAMN04487964_101138 [Marinobacterium sediminicola]